MTKEKLEELFHIQKEISSLEKRITRIEKQSSEVADVVQNGAKGHTVKELID